MFTSTAHMATHVFMLTRSNTEVPKLTGVIAPVAARISVCPIIVVKVIRLFAT
jgi:hypothetical protein